MSPLARIPAGGEIEIGFDQCFFTTYGPGPGARVKGVYLAAREGLVSTNIDIGPEVIRSGGHAPTTLRPVP